MHLLILACCLIILLILKHKFFSKKLNDMQTPFGLPIIGHLHYLAPYSDNPWKGFDSIRIKYGAIVSLQLGSNKAVLISSIDLIREVLLMKGEKFANRPKFSRFDDIFRGDRQYSLALCDWSEKQKERRMIASTVTLPRFQSVQYIKMAETIETETQIFMEILFNDDHKEIVIGKMDFLKYATNIFLKYLCSMRFEYNDPRFVYEVFKYDYIFYEVNQCYLTDFLPFLLNLGIDRSYRKKLKHISSTLSEYLEEIIVKPRLQAYAEKLSSSEFEEDNFNNDYEDFLDIIIKHHLKQPDETSWKCGVFEVLDLVGGSTPIGTMIMRLLGFLALNKDVQDELYNEIKCLEEKYSNKSIKLDMRIDAPYTEACILETLRLVSSPIVPHLPSEDTYLAGYPIAKDTMILFNSYYLNMSTDFWIEPEQFNPSRFLSDYNDNKRKIKKPDNFFPFSIGKRSCLGQRMLTYTMFVVIGNILLRYLIEKCDDKIESQLKTRGNISLPYENCFQLKLIKRSE